MGKKIEVHVTGKCEYNCIFCSVNKHPLPEPSSEQIKKDIDLTEGFSMITFTGGEPILRKDLIDLVRYAHRIHSRILIETHGFGLTTSCIKKLIDSGVTEIKISCHSHNKKAYYNTTRNKKSFKVMFEALKNLNAFSDKLEVETNTVITRYNANSLTKTVEWINQDFPFVKKIRISYPRFYPIKRNENYCKKYILPLPNLRKEFKKIINLKNNKVFFENVPLCVADLPSPKYFSWELYLSINGKITKGWDERYYPDKCNLCSKKELCQGIHKYYASYFKPNFIKPFKNF